MKYDARKCYLEIESLIKCASTLNRTNYVNNIK